MSWLSCSCCNAISGPFPPHPDRYLSYNNNNNDDVTNEEATAAEHMNDNDRNNQEEFKTNNNNSSNSGDVNANTPPHPIHININEDDHQHQQQNKQNENVSSLSPLRRYLAILHKTKHDHTATPSTSSLLENEIKKGSISVERGLLPSDEYRNNKYLYKLPSSYKQWDDIINRLPDAWRSGAVSMLVDSLENLPCKTDDDLPFLALPRAAMILGIFEKMNRCLNNLSCGLSAQLMKSYVFICQRLGRKHAGLTIDDFILKNYVYLLPPTFPTSSTSPSFLPMSIRDVS